MFVIYSELNKTFIFSNDGKYVKIIYEVNNVNPMQKVSIHYASLSRSERETCDLIMKDPTIIVENSITDASSFYHVSVASIQRLVKKIGYKGYSEFRYALEDFINHQDQKLESKEQDMNSILRSYENVLSAMKNIYYEDELKKLAKIMHERRIFSIGMGNSALPAKQLIHSLYIYNQWGNTIEDTVSMHLLENIADEKCVFIIFSVSAKNEEIIHSIKKWHKKGVHIALITCNGETVAKNIVNQLFVLPTLFPSNKKDGYQFRYMDSRALFLIFVDAITYYYQNI